MLKIKDRKERKRKERKVELYFDDATVCVQRRLRNLFTGCVAGRNRLELVESAMMKVKVE